MWPRFYYLIGPIGFAAWYMTRNATLLTRDFLVCVWGGGGAKLSLGLNLFLSVYIFSIVNLLVAIQLLMLYSVWEDGVDTELAKPSVQQGDWDRVSLWRGSELEVHGLRHRQRHQSSWWWWLPGLHPVYSRGGENNIISPQKYVTITMYAYNVVALWFSKIPSAVSWSTYHPLPPLLLLPPPSTFILSETLTVFQCLQYISLWVYWLAHKFHWFNLPTESYKCSCWLFPYLCSDCQLCHVHQATGKRWREGEQEGQGKIGNYHREWVSEWVCVYVWGVCVLVCVNEWVCVCVSLGDGIINEQKF